MISIYYLLVFLEDIREFRCGLADWCCSGLKLSGSLWLGPDSLSNASNAVGVENVQALGSLPSNSFLLGPAVYSPMPCCLAFYLLM